MIFALPLAKRLRIARHRNARYRSDAEYRLRCINETRARRGRPPITSLDEMSAPQWWPRRKG